MLGLGVHRPCEKREYVMRQVQLVDHRGDEDRARVRILVDSLPVGIHPTDRKVVQKTVT